MTEDKGKKSLEEFKGHVETSQNIQRSMNEARDPHIADDIKSNARKLVAKEGHAWYRETGGNLPAFNPDDIQQYALAEQHASAYSSVRDSQANNTLRGNLKPMVDALSKKQLETILNEDEGKPMISVAQSAGKDYAGWFKLYVENNDLAGLVSRAESGKLTESDVARIENRATNKRLEAVAKALDKRGVKDPVVKAGSQNLVQDTIRAEYTLDKKAYANSAKSIKSDSDKELANYEKESKKDFYGFVKAGFENLAKDAQGFKAVRDIIYKSSKVKG